MCRKTKPFDAFAIQRAARDGHQNRCKTCTQAHHQANTETAKAYAARSYKKNKDRVLTRSAARNAADPQARAAETAARYQRNIVVRKAQIVAWNTANPERRRAIYEQNYDKERERLYRAKWRAANPEQARAAAVAGTNARRARQYGAQVTGPVARTTRRALLDDPCAYCGAPSVEVDHIRPLSRGGWEHESNMVGACRACNASKHRKLLTEWDPIRVRHAAQISLKVAAALEWQVAHVIAVVTRR